jgi:hypothetical protein
MMHTVSRFAAAAASDQGSCRKAAADMKQGSCRKAAADMKVSFHRRVPILRRQCRCNCPREVGRFMHIFSQIAAGASSVHLFFAPCWRPASGVQFGLTSQIAPTDTRETAGFCSQSGGTVDQGCVFPPAVPEGLRWLAFSSLATQGANIVVLPSRSRSAL